MLYSTSRTAVSLLKEEDLLEILEMYIEPDSFRYIQPHKDKTIEYYQHFLLGKIESNKKKEGFWVVRNKQQEKLIGTVNLNQFRETSMNHIGCHLKREYWNQGFATELLKPLINYGFNKRGLEVIHGIVEEGNITSSKLMHKLGFTFKNQIIEDNVKLNIYFFFRLNYLESKTKDK